MKVIKKINTSALLVKDDDGRELVVFGNGISFKITENMMLDERLVEKRFFLEVPGLSKHYVQLVERIPFEYIEFSEAMIQRASEALRCTLNPSIYISLPDHIAFSIERFHNNLIVESDVHPDIQIFYPEEYEVARMIVNQTNQRFHVDLGESEIVYITFHLINAMLNQTDNRKALTMTEMMTRIMGFIESEVSFKFDKDSFDYRRLVIHVKFFVQRILFKKRVQVDTPNIFDPLFQRSKEYQMTLRIAQRISKEFDISISHAEINYLAIHILKNEQSMNEGRRFK